MDNQKKTKKKKKENYHNKITEINEHSIITQYLSFQFSSKKRKTNRLD